MMGYPENHSFLNHLLVLQYEFDEIYTEIERKYHKHGIQRYQPIKKIAKIEKEK
jgi:hypothetical protein